MTADAPRLASDAAELQRIVAASGSSFVHGMRILPARRRRAIYAIYAFCRVVDDIVDGPGDPATKSAALDEWDAELDAVEARSPDTAIGRALLGAIGDHDLPPEEFRLIIEGMRMDITPIVAPPEDELGRYVRRVAGTVGLLSMRVFGAWRGEVSQRFALSLAEALQLTNILRDVEEDATMGRIYLPRPVLDDAGVRPDPATIADDPGLPHARAALGARARAAFRDAARDVPAHNRLALIPALLMMGPYERLLRRMEMDWRRPPPRAGWRRAMDGLVRVTRGGGGV